MCVIKSEGGVAIIKAEDIVFVYVGCYNMALRVSDWVAPTDRFRIEISSD